MGCRLEAGRARGGRGPGPAQGRALAARPVVGDRKLNLSLHVLCAFVARVPSCCSPRRGAKRPPLRLNFSGRVCLEPTISPEINRGVMHAVGGAWPVSVESQWLIVFGVVGRPLNTPPQCALFHRRSRNRLCAETVTKRPLGRGERIVQQTDWPRCIRIVEQEWPPCRGDTWCCVAETLLADSEYGR